MTASPMIASASSRRAEATVGPSRSRSPIAANRASIRSIALRTGAAVGAAFRRAFAVPKRIARRACGDATSERPAVRARPQAATWPSNGAPRTTDSRIACATSAPETQANSTSSSGRRRWSSRTTCSGSRRKGLRNPADRSVVAAALAPTRVIAVSADPRNALAISAEPSRSAPAAPTTVAAVFIASAARDRKNCRRPSRRASSGSAGPPPRGATVPGSGAGRRSSVKDPPPPRPASVRDDRGDRVAGEPVAALEEPELDEERQSDDLALESLDQLHRPVDGPTRCEQVVHDEDLLARLDRVAVDLQRVGSVFERVLDADGLRRQLAELAYGYEAGAQLVGHRGREDEAA